MERKKKAGNKNYKEKETTCFKCGKKGHYSNECDEEQIADEQMVKTSNKTGSNILIVNDIQHGYSSDEDNTEGPFKDSDFMAMQEANEENEESHMET